MTFPIYPILNQEVSSFSSRSYLYQLHPMGVDTALVESLSSYITRLAEAHCVSPRILMSKVIVPAIPKACKSFNLYGMSKWTGAINGTGSMSFDLVQVLENLTAQPNLRLLTLLPWRNIFPQLKLTRSIKAWCPECYQQWHFNNQPLYDPLLWFIEPIEMCLHHQRYLSTQCPKCHQQLPLLASGSRIGYCCYCQSWLGLPDEYQLPQTSLDKNEFLNWNFWVSETLGDLLQSSSSLSYFDNPNLMSQLFSHYIEQLTGGNIAVFARLFHLPKNTVWMWQKGEVLPQIETLLKICYHLKLSLLNFLVNWENNIVNEQLLGISNNEFLQKNRKRTQKTLNIDEIKQALLNILDDNSKPPPPMTEVAKLIGYDKRTIHRHFPSICRAISAKYLANLHQTRLERLNIACTLVQEAVEQLYTQEIYPTPANVTKFLKKPGIFRDKEVKVAFHQARKKLGLEN